MSTTELELVSKIERLCKLLGIPLDTVVKVYCQGAEVPEEIEDKLLELENRISEELGVSNVNQVFKIVCRCVKDKISVEIEKKEAEQVIRIPVFVQGEQHYINIVLSGKDIRVESDIEGICPDPSDILLGYATLYVKCNGTWLNFVHRLAPEVVDRLRKMLRRE